ncbi:hypothetical protein LTR39_000020 [Cryomyces antarcticus]|nr:hypothetical protein LTR39_000020 [Cryomyces antarcticus]
MVLRTSWALALVGTIAPLAYVMQYASDLVPRSVVRWAMNADLRRVMKGVLTLTLSRQITATVMSDMWPEPSPARMLIVAATKGLTDDRIHDAVRLRGIEKQKNPTSIHSNSIAISVINTVE